MDIANSSGVDRRRFALTLAGTAAFTAAGAEGPGAAKLWTDVPHWMELACAPGAVVAVIEKGKAGGVHAFGVRRAEEVGAVDASTIFEAASLSKPVFASAVLRLVAAKALDLDRPLDQILPLSTDPRAKLITARHVLSHSSGLQNWRNPPNDKFEFRFPPGEQFSYSGEGYFYLQRVVEKITARPFAQYMRETVFDPLGMTRSSYLWRDDPNSASPHGNRGRPFEQFKAATGKQMTEIAAEWKKPVESWFYADVERAMPRLKLPVLPNFMQPNAAATLITTAPDYAKFLLHSFSIDAMRQPQVRINSDLSWGLGCGLEAAGGRQWFWHWGDNPGFKNFFIADANSGSGVLVFTNGDGGAKVYQRIVSGVLGRDFSAFLWI
jgi:CubicO group peptidase (beta-lactamase class C family)